jgi:tRNA threonylcarbamoyladenosine biosynthesis protein TsaB
MTNLSPSNFLHIDTHDSANTKIKLSIAGENYDINIKSDSHKSQNVLPAIQNLIQKNNLNLNNINAITVSTGPGSYTGLRVGIAIAKSIGWLYHISVNGKSVTEDINPLYSDSKF